MYPDGKPWEPTPTNLLSGHGCPACSDRLTLSQEEFFARLQSKNPNIHTKDKYINARTNMLFYCDHKHEFYLTPNSALQGRGCPYCSGRRVINGETDLWTLRPDIASVLKNTNDGHIYGVGSHKKLDFVCPDCGKESCLDLHSVVRQGFHCRWCGDGVSYPNKFSYAFLYQLPVMNWKREWQPDWAKPFFYDNYFEYNNRSYILEMDGHIGHGNKSFDRKINIDGKLRDEHKDNLAIEHNISVIRVDCAYNNMADRFTYIYEQLVSSSLSDIFDLSCVDWNKCNTSALSSYVRKVASLYNQHISIGKIANDLCYSRNTIVSWLKQATTIGLCEYRTDAHKQPLNLYNMSGEFIQSFTSYKEAGIYSGIDPRHLRYAANSNTHYCKGILVYLVSDTTQPDKSKIID